MITVRLMGGLGNQLFQIFTTINYAIKYGHKFIFSYSKYLVSNTTRETYWESFLEPLKIFTTENPKTNIGNAFLNTFKEVNFPYHNFQNIPIFKIDENIRLVGYFQSFKYFQEYEDSIFSLIKLNFFLDKIKKEYSELFDDKYIISMHFRLGDYKHIQNCHNILPQKYYEMAMEYMVPLIDKPIKILVFCESEDNDYVMNIINNLKEKWPEIQYEKINDNIIDWKQLLLMALCDSNIIANSSFSWWGAYFNRNKDKMVTYPSVWFGPSLIHNYMGDMFPTNWKQICF